MKTISFELEDDEAKALEDFCAEMGLGVQSLMTLFSKQTLRESKAPIRLSAASRTDTIKSNADFLSETDIAELTAFLSGENALIAAVVLSLLDEAKAAAVIERLSEKERNTAMEMLLQGLPLSEPVIEAVTEDVRRRLLLKEAEQERSVGGIERTAKLLESFDRQTEKAIMKRLEERESEIAAALKDKLFFFENITRLSDRDIQKALREIDSSELAKALKDADSEVREKIFRNMSKKVADRIKEEMEFMGPVRLKDVYAAQARFVGIIERLAEHNEIDLFGNRTGAV